MLLVTNLSLMFTEVPLIERFQAAADAGFSRVEIQFPYEADPGALVAARDAAGVEMILVNVPAGDMAAGDVGLTSLPGRTAEYREAVETCLIYAKALGVSRVNSLAGRPAEGRTPDAADTLTENLRYAADRFAEIGVTVLVEPINPYDVPGFYLTSLDQAIEAVERADRPNVKILFDLYHLAQTEDSLNAAAERAAGLIGHVQFADVPGRVEPGAGTIDFAAAFDALRRIGYEDCISAEYRPVATTVEGLGWMPDLEPWLDQ
jgi:hydroxypyruvate isomerase